MKYIIELINKDSTKEKPMLVSSKKALKDTISYLNLSAYSGCLIKEYPFEIKHNPKVKPKLLSKAF